MLIGQGPCSLTGGPAGQKNLARKGRRGRGERSGKESWSDEDKLANGRNGQKSRVALSLARAGLSVFPSAPSKRPPVKRQAEATAHPATLGCWWHEWPKARVGLSTGQRSGVLVIDCNVGRETRERVGEESLAALGLGDLL